MLIKDMNKEQLIQEFKNIMGELKKDIDNDKRFQLETKASRIEKKLYKKYNIEIRG